MRIHIFLLLALFAIIMGCKKDQPNTGNENYKIIFLHHSTGDVIWRGGVENLMDSYNSSNNTNYYISKIDFPKSSPYGWNNYPYDYYNIWVKNAGDQPYLEEPTLEILSKDYNLIIWKHCFPGANIQDDDNFADINSNYKSIANYKLQYNALKEKMHEFPDTKFLVWTLAALTEDNTNEENAKRAKEFYEWVINDWDELNDNIFIWDFYSLETEGSLYLLPEYAKATNNSHPKGDFAEMVAPYFVNRIIQVIEGSGNNTNLTGKE